MAKVMISLPDDLLAQVDVEAQRRGTTRSAVMRSFARAALDERDAHLAEQMRVLDEFSSRHGGDNAAVLKSARPV